MSSEEPTAALDARFKQLAACVSAEDWDRLIGATSERMLRRLSATGLLDDASPEQLKQALALLGAALVDYTNVALTTVADGALKLEARS